MKNNNNNIITIKMKLMYDGSRYLGWQRLQGEQKSLTIQYIIECILNQVLKEECRIHGAGRTDAGVHAYGQVAHFTVHEKQLDEKQLYHIKKQLNERLPEDIKIISMEKVSRGFHSRYDAKAKRYTYHISIGERPSVFQRKYTTWISEELDINAMKKGAEALIGTHDFKGFSNKMKDGRDTIKTVFKTEIVERKGEIIISVLADGFLYHMMRIMIGTLLEIGMNKRSISSIQKIFQEGNREIAGYTVQGNALFLQEIFYELEHIDHIQLQ